MADDAVTKKPSGGTDERVKEMSSLRRALIRPELGAFCGAVLVFVFFMITAGDSGMFAADGVMNWVVVSSQFAVLAAGACLLMIAGEFDLSIGSMIGFAGIVIATLAVHFGMPVWFSIICAFVACLTIGFINGYLVIKTGLPSFIVTLAFLFILRGLTIWLAILITRSSIISGVRDAAEGDPLAALFSGEIFEGLFIWLAEKGLIGTYIDGAPVVSGIPAMVVWAVMLVIIGQFVLTKTQWGNWIFASGGDAKAARHSGVPVNRVKITMFMVTAFCACVFASVQVLEFGSAAADRGLLKEFEAIISVVIGGALLTGGYGTVVGAALGALIFGVVQQGLFFAGVESSLFRVFLGSILLIAVIFNTYIRRLITGER